MKHLAIALCLCILSIKAWSIPQAPFDSLKSSIEPPPSNSSQEYNYEGIVKLSNCSGSIIKFIGQDLSDKAIVLTNGHCIGRPFLKPGQVVYKKRVRRRMRVADQNKRFHRIMATELIYATMTDTDAAYYRLKETYQDLERLGIRPFTLSNTKPQRGTKIEIVSGYWERGYSCAIDEFIYKLKEGSWTFSDSIRYTSPGCQVIGGTSGSPIIEQGTRKVIAINNTANESGKKCEMNNPCEIDENDYVSVIKGASYGQQTYLVYSCLNEQNKIDLQLPTCELPR